MKRALALVALITGSASGVVVHNESVNGQLSGNHLAPTPLGVLSPGTNIITGTIGASPVPDVPDLDYATFTVAPGFEIDQLLLVDADVGGAVSFIGMQAGPVISQPYTAGDPSALLGWTHFGTADEGLDLLPAIGGGPGAIGFFPPLPSGTYTLWTMELDTGRAYRYSFDIHVRRACAADLDDGSGSGTADGGVDINDLLYFLNRFEAGSTAADLDNGSGAGTPDGGVDINDLLFFLVRFEGGC